MLHLQAKRTDESQFVVCNFRNVFEKAHPLINKNRQPRAVLVSLKLSSQNVGISLAFWLQNVAISNILHFFAGISFCGKTITVAKSINGIGSVDPNVDGFSVDLLCCRRC